MFADNGKISHRQLKRQMLLSLCGVLLLFMSGDLLEAGRSGILGVLVGAVVLLLYLGRASRCKHAQDAHGQRVLDGYFIWKVLIMGSFLVFTGAHLLRECVRVTGEYLLPKAPEPILAVVLLIVSVLGVGTVPERRARMAEIACSIYFWGILLLLLLAALHAEVPDILQMPALSAGRIIDAGWSFLAVGITVTTFPMTGLEICKSKKKRNTGIKKENDSNQNGIAYKSVWATLALLIVGTMLILFGTYGYRGANSLEFPLWHLMSGTNLPGKFLERFDIIWMSLFLFGIMFTLGSVVFYGVQLFPEFREYTVLIQSAVTVLVGIYWMVSEAFPNLQFSYLPAVKYIYAPLFLLFHIFWLLPSRSNYHTKYNRRQKI